MYKFTRKGTIVYNSRIAIIGSGVAGLSAAWLLQGRYRVSLYEANDYVGGHTNTIQVPGDRGQVVPVDTGFIVYNERNYPLLTALLAHLGVDTRPSEMSFAASIDRGALEYSGSDIGGLFAQRRNLLRPAFLGMLADILRFNRDARRLLGQPQSDTGTLGDYLRRGGFGTAFRDHYILPMAAAIWSCPTSTMLEFPLASFLRFFHNHGLIDLAGRPQWRTLCNGSQSYVKAMLSDFGGKLHLKRPVTSVRQRGQSWEVTSVGGQTEQFDQVVFGCHADQALRLLASPGRRQRSLLGAFRYQPNRALLHSDPALMPKRRRVWSSWNYTADSDDQGTRAVSVTYWMNRLQGLPDERLFLVSLNPSREPHADTLIREISYRHPVFDNAAIQAQNRLQHLQGDQGLWFCGSYFGYGFHEDALRSAVGVVKQLGVEPPWQDGAGEGRMQQPGSTSRAAA